MKKLLPVFILLTVLTNAQVGINTSSPQATLDIDANTISGTNPEGLAVPRVNRLKAQSMANPPLSTLIFVDDITTGTQIGKAIRVDAIGFYYFNGSIWVKLENPNNSTYNDTSIYNTDGTLTGNRIVTQGGNTLSFNSTAANAFSVDGTTFSVNAATNAVGIGTTTPSNTLHVEGSVRISDGTEGVNKIFVSNASGVGSWIPLENTKLIMALKPTEAETILNNTAPGNATNLTKFQQIVNSIPGATYTPSATAATVNLPEGTYEISISLEMNATGTCPTTPTVPNGFLVNSYYVDFFETAGAVRLHSNSTSVCGSNSVHHVQLIQTVTITGANVNWPLHLGRGVGGNYSSFARYTQSSSILIKKIL